RPLRPRAAGLRRAGYPARPADGDPGGAPLGRVEPAERGGAEAQLLGRDRAGADADRGHLRDELPGDAGAALAVRLPLRAGPDDAVQCRAVVALPARRLAVAPPTSRHSRATAVAQRPSPPRAQRPPRPSLRSRDRTVTAVTSAVTRDRDG